MKRSLLLFALFAFAVSGAFAQVTSVTVEEFYTDDSSVSGYPVGYTTYRIYANCTSPDDRVASISGNDDAPLIFSLSGSGIWNHPLGNILGNFANCGLYGTVPAVEYDSYVTLDYTCTDGSVNTIYSVEDAAQPWKTQLFHTMPLGAAGITLNTSIGGGWFGIPSVADPGNDNTRAGADLKVLLAQITTDGSICGIINLQCFPDYNDLDDDYILQTGFQFGSIDCGVPGCTDPEALNYSDLAEFDNGLCLYECDIDFSEITLTDPTCSYNEDGSIYFEGEGAQDYIRYLFDGDTLGSNGLTPLAIEDLGNGVHTITIRDTRFENENFNPGGMYGTCEVSQDVELFTAEIMMSGIIVTDVDCAEDANGCAEVETYEGGTGDLLFKIFNDDDEQLLDAENNPLELAGPNYCGLSGGTYYYKATDENGCEANSDLFDIYEPLEITLFEGAESPASCFNSADATQVITFSGGTGDIDFEIDGDEDYEIEGGAFNVILSDLAPGEYMIYAMDENGCIGSTDFEVAGGPEIEVMPMVNMPSCNGDTDGIISLMADGGTGDLSYSFDGDVYSDVSEMSDLAAGDYTVYVQDENNCIAEVTVTVDEPAVLGGTASSNDILCNGEENGTIELSGEGGTEPYAFSLDDETYTPSPNFSGLAAGTYSGYVMDANGCSYVIADDIAIEEPSAITATAAAGDVLCNGDDNGQITVTASGGTGSYEYSTGGAFSSANPITGLDADDYDVTVIDDNGCEFVISDIEVDEPAELEIDGLSNDNIDEDAGGNTAYTVSGGTAPYDYSWEDSDGDVVSTSVNLPDFTASSDAGTYTLTITDDNGCTATQSITITGINEIGYTYSIEVYPNPSNGLYTVNLKGLAGAKTTYSITDQAGRVVAAKELGNVSGSRTENIDLTFCAAGVYYMTFMVGEQTQTAKLIIE